MTEIESKEWLNCIIEAGFDPVDGIAIFPQIAMANHSCAPNTRVVFGDSACAQLIATRDIESGEELLT